MKTSILLLLLSLLSLASLVVALFEILSPTLGETYYTNNVLTVEWNTTGFPSQQLNSSAEPSTKTTASKTTKSSSINSTSITSLVSPTESTESSFFKIVLYNAEVENTTSYPNFKTIGSDVPTDQGNYSWKVETFQGARTYLICLGNATIDKISCSSNFSISYPLTLDPSSTGNTYGGASGWPSRCYTCDAGFNPASIIGIVVGGLAVAGVVYGVVRGLKRKPGSRRIGLGLRGVLPSYQRTLEDPPPDYVEQPPSYRSTSSVPMEGHDITDATLSRIDEWGNRTPVMQSIETNSPIHVISNASDEDNGSASELQVMLV